MLRALHRNGFPEALSAPVGLLRGSTWADPVVTAGAYVHRQADALGEVLEVNRCAVRAQKSPLRGGHRAGFEVVCGREKARQT